MQALNYSTQAIPYFRQFEKHEYAGPKTKLASGHIAAHLESSHKFILPVGGRLFDETVPSMLPVFRLPFPMTTLEYEVRRDREVGKRIVIGFECESYGRFGAQLWALEQTPREGWGFLWAGVHIPYGQSPVFNIPATQLDEGRKSTGFGFESCYVVIGETGDQRAREMGGMGSAEFKHTMSKLTSGIQNVVLQFCAALKCSNVSTEHLDPPVKLQAKRAKEGKLPLFSYHILTVGNASPTAHTGATGSHSSPRTHLRRGHIRNHPTAGFVWVQSCVVNPGAKGSVNKDYAVTSRRAVMEALKC